MVTPEITRTLRSISWDFASSRVGYIGPPHWYPATFIPALSDALIDAIAPPDGVVFDPYCGIGTTGWSAIRTGRSCQLVDLNPVATLVSYTSNSLLALARVFPTMALQVLGDVSRIAGRKNDLFGYDVPGQTTPAVDIAVSGLCNPSPQSLLSQVVIGPPNKEALGAWFASDTLASLETLLAENRKLESTFGQLLGLCMLSSVARGLSSQNASWGHIADNVKPKGLKVQNVHMAMSHWVKRMASFIGVPMRTSAHHGKARTLELWRSDWSTGQIVRESTADLLLTSPPYADAIDYTLSQRLSLYLFGYDDAAIQRLVSSEIGARRKRFRSCSRSDWTEDLCRALRQQVKWVKPTGAICMVLPHKDSGRSDVDVDVKAILQPLGWFPFFETDRSIHQSHTRQSWTSIKRETIVGFSREDC